MKTDMKYSLKYLGICFAISVCICHALKSQSFLQNAIDREITCDTIFNSKIRGGTRVLAVKEKLDPEIIKYQSYDYVKYNLSLNANSHHSLLRSDDKGIWIFPINRRKNSVDFKDQPFIKFDAKPGDTWEIRGVSGLLTNSKVLLDSLKKVNGDAIFYLSSTQIYEVSDQVYWTKMKVSKQKGILEITLFDDAGYGDEIKCECTSEK